MVCVGSYYVIPSFVIKVRADDVGALVLVQEAIGCGRITDERVYRGTHTQRRYVVNKVSDLIEFVVPFFRAYPLRAKKHLDFEIWAEAVELLWEIQQRKRPGRTGSRWTPSDRERIASLSAACKQVKRWHPVTKTV